MGEIIISTGVPSDKCGISTSGRIFEITPLLPCLPASLSPMTTWRNCAASITILRIVPGSSSSPFFLSKIETLMIVPRSPWGIRSDVSLTSLACSPKIALKSLSSAVNSVSPFGAILPTIISPGATSEPTTTIPSSSRFARSSSETFGISLVVSSGPNFVSTTDASYFSI